MTTTNTEITELVGSVLVGEIVAGSFHTLRKNAQTTRELLKLAGKRFAETPSDVRGQLTTLFYNVEVQRETRPMRELMDEVPRGF